MIVSCDDQVDTLEGAYFYTSITADTNVVLELPIGQLNASIGGNFIVKGPKNGSQVEKIDVFVAFKDVVTDGAPSQSSADVLVKSILGAELLDNIGNSLRPEFNYTITQQELISATGITISSVNGSDEFVLSFKITDKDGKHFSNVYNAPVVCPPTTAPTPGTWKITLRELYGDTWDGGSLVITIDGVATQYNSNLNLEEKSFNVPSGTSILRIGYKGGSYDNENGFKILNPNGKTVIDIPIGGIPRGSIPRGTISELTPDYCAY